MTVPNAMAMIVSVSAARRPCVSPYRPMMMPPKGRIKNPTPNTASDANSPTEGLPAGKKVCAIVPARKI
jgi:hypothetical protein